MGLPPRRRLTLHGADQQHEQDRRHDKAQEADDVTRHESHRRQNIPPKNSQKNRPPLPNGRRPPTPASTLGRKPILIAILHWRSPPCIWLPTASLSGL